MNFIKALIVLITCLIALEVTAQSSEQITPIYEDEYVFIYREFDRFNNVEALYVKSKCYFTLVLILRIGNIPSETYLPPYVTNRWHTYSMCQGKTLQGLEYRYNNQFWGDNKMIFLNEFTTFVE